MVTRGTWTPFDLEVFHERISQLYSESEEDLMMTETFACELFMKSSVNSYQTAVAIKHPSVPGVDFLSSITIPNNKHMSINRLQPKFKQIKKLSEIHIFKKETSVFAEWRQDNQQFLDSAFKADIDYSKLPKVLKNMEDLSDTKMMLRANFGQLKTLFINLIASPKSYPVISWLQFVDRCKEWKIIDNNLTISEVENAFKSTVYEVDILNDTDGRVEHTSIPASEWRPLCRYEFLEVLVRLAKAKYFDKRIQPSVADSLIMLLEQEIYPNNKEIMFWQEFRTEQLWRVEIDSILKANRQAIEKLFANFSAKSTVKRKNFSKDEVLELLRLC